VKHKNDYRDWNFTILMAQATMDQLKVGPRDFSMCIYVINV